MKIKYRLIDGEPMCDSQCEARHMCDVLYCAVLIKTTADSTERTMLPTYDGAPCIPGLREQRDRKVTQDD